MTSAIKTQMTNEHRINIMLLETGVYVGWCANTIQVGEALVTVYTKLDNDTYRTGFDVFHPASEFSAFVWDVDMAIEYIYCINEAMEV